MLKNRETGRLRLAGKKCLAPGQRGLVNEPFHIQEARYVIKSVICDPNFEGLVLGCIEADFCNQILVGKLLTRSIRLIFFCTAPLAKFQQFFDKLFAKFANVSKEIRKFLHF